MDTDAFTMRLSLLLLIAVACAACFSSASTVECTPGTLTCPCDDDTCRDDLQCQPDLMRCINPECVGAFGCVCGQADACDAMLVCENGVCVGQSGSSESSASATGVATSSMSTSSATSTSTSDATSSSTTTPQTTTMTSSTTGPVNLCAVCFEDAFRSESPACGAGFDLCDVDLNCTPIIECIEVECVDLGLGPGTVAFYECSSTCAESAMDDIYSELSTCVNTECFEPCGGDVLG